MRLTKTKLKSIIKEELNTLNQQKETLNTIIAEETINYFDTLGEDIRNNPEKLKKICYQVGMRSYQQWLKILNQIERASDGKLNDKPKQNETELMVDKNCGNPHKKEDGTWGSKEDEGIKSSYFCDNEPRTTNKGKSIPSQFCGRTSRQAKPSKDIPCNPKLRKQRGIK